MNKGRLVASKTNVINRLRLCKTGIIMKVFLKSEVYLEIQPSPVERHSGFDNLG